MYYQLINTACAVSLKIDATGGTIAIGFLLYVDFGPLTEQLFYGP